MSSKSTAFEAKSFRWYSSYTSATVWSQNEATRDAYSSGEISWFFAFEIWAWIPRGVNRFGVLAELLEAGLDHAHLVGLVVDRERRAVAEPLGLAPQDAAARGVEREDPDRPRRAAEDPLEPFPHLGRGLVRERDREDLVRLHAVRADQMGDAMGEDARLARPGAGDDEERPLHVEHRLALRRLRSARSSRAG